MPGRQASAAGSGGFHGLTPSFKSKRESLYQCGGLVAQAALAAVRGAVLQRYVHDRAPHCTGEFVQQVGLRVEEIAQSARVDLGAKAGHGRQKFQCLASGSPCFST
jgi:hypothetical protein